MSSVEQSAHDRIRGRIVGRDRELELLLAAVSGRRDLILEGPPGTGKSTMLRAITEEWGIPLVLVEGNAELTSARMLGYHDPARVLEVGYGEETFVPGPLVTAMREGAFLYVEELNRTPEETLNTLLMAIADRQVVVPRAGIVHAEPGFRLIASMNPFDNVGTGRISQSVHDRLCRLAVGYQDEEDERDVVALRTSADPAEDLAGRLLRDAVAVCRATREHEDVRQGSSVRGAIDTLIVARELAGLRGLDGPEDDRYAPLFLDAMIMGLSGRIRLGEVTERTPEDVLRQIWEDLVVLGPALADPG